jgi:hypothetical protein
MDADKIIQAEFVKKGATNYSLAMTVVGEGKATPFGGLYTEGSSAKLEAFPSDGWKFYQWRGDVDVKNDGFKNPLTITMDKSKSVTAIFILKESSIPSSQTITQADQMAQDAKLASSANEKSGDGDFSPENLISSCTLLSVVVMMLIIGGFGILSGKLKE